jgi:hypothetical protein
VSDYQEDEGVETSQKLAQAHEVTTKLQTGSTTRNKELKLFKKSARWLCQLKNKQMKSKK